MLHIHKQIIFALMGIVFFALTSAASAQDEVRLTDGGVLQGKIIRETDTMIELKHRTFGVIQIPRSKILEIGAYGTLPDSSSESSPESGNGEASSSRVRSRTAPRSASRLDLDYQPEKYEPVGIPEELIEKEDPAELLEAEKIANPELASLYDKLLNRDVIRDEDAKVLFALNEKWESEPESLSILESAIVKALVGDAGEPAAAQEQSKTDAPPPPLLAPVVDEIREKLAGIDQLQYRELYTVTNPDGKIIIRYERQVQRPNLAAGTGEVVEHVDPAQQGRATRYFSNGNSLWLLTRHGEGAGEAFVSRSPGADQFTDEEKQERVLAFEAPEGTRVEYSTWGEAGFPAGEMTRSLLMLRPFDIMDLSTLKLVSEDDAERVFSANLDSPAFDPLDTIEFRVAKASGLLVGMKMTGSSLEAEMEFSDVRADIDLAPETFIVPEAPAGEEFREIAAPESQDEALTALGAL